MTARLALVALSLAFAGAFAGGSLAQTPKPATPLPPVKPATAEEKLPAKLLFSQKKLPSLGRAMAIGFYPRGCLQGGVELPVDGPNWQVMRLSRNRNWGHPELVKFLERFAPLAAKATGWHGILVGDMARRAAAVRTRQPSDRARRRHLVHADAEPRTEPAGAREYLRQQSGHRRQAARRPENLDAGRRRLHPHRGGTARGRAHFRQCRDQEGAVPCRRQKT